MSNKDSSFFASSGTLMKMIYSFANNALSNVRGSQRSLIYAAIISILVARFSLSENWTLPYTPDSEFYLTLGVFGSAVTERAVTPAYYWTKLGIVAPINSLSNMFGPYVAYSLFRLLLIFLVVWAGFKLSEAYKRGPMIGSLLGISFGLNSVFLFWFGNTYMTGASIAVLVLSLSLTIFMIRSGEKKTFTVETISLGICFAWLVMINPWTFLIAVSTITAMFLTSTNYKRKEQVFSLFKTLTFMAIGGLAGLGIFLLWGEVIFPGSSWLQTIIFWNENLPKGGYISQSIASWLPSKTSLLLSLAPIVLLLMGGKRFFQESNKSYIVLISVVPASIYLHASFVNDGPALEAPFYSALLIPFALIAMFATLFELTKEDSEIENWAILRIGIVAFVLIAIGHFGAATSPIFSLILVSSMTFTILILARLRPLGSKNWSARHSLFVTVSLVTVMFQLVQNLEPGPESGAVMSRTPYHSAFRNSDIPVAIKARIDSENWLIENTLQSEIGLNKTLVIGDVRFASMQLWGPNAASSSGTLTDWDKSNLTNVKPNIIASYESEAIPVSDTFFIEVASLGATLAFTKCSEFVFSSEGDIVTVCVYKYDWPQ